MNELEKYIQEVISKGDEGSQLLASLTAPTLKNPIKKGNIRILKDGMNGLAVLEVPKDYSVMVHSRGGDTAEKDLSRYTHSLIHNLIQTSYPGSTPVAFANVVDSNSGDIGMLRTIGTNLKDLADVYDLAILNGENAVLGERVNVDANLSGTMISLIKKTKLKGIEGFLMRNGIHYAFFDPKRSPVLINSDGVGTKTEFYERSGDYHKAIEDFMAMNLDDTIKIAAKARIISGVIEYSGDIPTEKIRTHLEDVAKTMGILGILQSENLEGRLKGYASGIPTYNISGSVVSTIDEERLQNPLKPKEGDFLIAIRSKNPNPRSNGITARRTLMNKLGSAWLEGTEFDEWHETSKGKEFLKYLATPSTIFYPIFSDLIEKGLASSVYHMSGGAFNGKLAKPLAKEGLFSNISNLFSMSLIEDELYQFSEASLETAFENWPMGNEGFITSDNASEAITYLENSGYEARITGRLESGKTGVEIHTPQGKVINYSGK